MSIPRNLLAPYLLPKGMTVPSSDKVSPDAILDKLHQNVLHKTHRTSNGPINTLWVGGRKNKN